MLALASPLLVPVPAAAVTAKQFFENLIPKSEKPPQRKRQRMHKAVKPAETDKPPLPASRPAVPAEPGSAEPGPAEPEKDAPIPLPQPDPRPPAEAAPAPVPTPQPDVVPTAPPEPAPAPEPEATPAPVTEPVPGPAPAPSPEPVPDAASGPIEPMLPPTPPLGEPAPPAGTVIAPADALGAVIPPVPPPAGSAPAPAPAEPGPPPETSMPAPQAPQQTPRPTPEPGELAACRAGMAGLAIVSEPEPPFVEGECGAPDPFKVTALDAGAVKLAPSAMIDCAVATTLARWLAEDVQPAAKAAFGSGVTGIQVAGSYSCRGRDNIAGAKLSEHSFMNAIDIGGFTVAGRTVAVTETSARTPSETTFLATIRAAACVKFTTVLGPGADAYHADHLHLDMIRRGRNGDSHFCQ